MEAECVNDFHPNHTIIIWNYDDCQEVSLRSHFEPFGTIELFRVVPNPLRRFPNMAVIQYSIASEASSALHGILAHPEKKLDVRQPWAAGFSEQLSKVGLTSNTLLQDIAKSRTVIYEVLRNAALEISNTVELYRFGKVISFNVRKLQNRTFAEIIYDSPLSASLAVIANTSSLFTVILARQINLDGTIHGLYVKKSDAHSTKYIYCQDRHKPRLYKSILEAEHFYNPTPQYSQSVWYAPRFNQLRKITDPLLLQVDCDNKLFFRAKFTLDGNDAVRDSHLNVNDCSAISNEAAKFQRLVNTTDLPCFDVQIMFDALNKNVLEDKVVLVHSTDIFDITNHSAQETWLSLFELRISVMRQFVNENWILQIDANISQTNYFFHELLFKNKAFPKVKADTFLAIPIIESQEKKDAVPLGNAGVISYGQSISGYESDEGKHIIQLVARSKELVSAFSIPIIAHKVAKVHANTKCEI